MPSEAVLGKRKRKPAQRVEEDDTDAPAVEDAQAIFRRYFETQFAPLEPKPVVGARGQKRTAADSDDEEDGNSVEDMRSDSESDDDDNEWGGVSGEDDEEDDESDNDVEDDSAVAATNTIEIVDHSKPITASATALQTAMMSKREMRAYLSSRPPDSTLTTDTITNIKSKGADGDDDPANEDSKTLLANDLALSRLISESHILAASNPFNAIGAATSASEAKAFTEGRTRKITTDMRLQKLGSKGSIFTQQKMPMGMRKGINTAKQDREDKRRREAKENGIILETAVKKGKKRSKGRGDVAVDMPGMGKFRNGELRLSTREVKAVERDGKRFDSGKKKRRR